MRDPRFLIGQHDPLHPSNLLIFFQLWWAFSVYHRPHLPEILPSYTRFTSIMPWAWWGWAAMIGACLLFLTRRSSPWRLVAHAWTGIFFMLVAGAFTAGSGLTSAGGTYSILGYISLVLFARSMVFVAQGTGWWAALVRHPPGWLRWLAGCPPRRPRGRH